jgi:hypothetical protein
VSDAGQNLSVVRQELPAMRRGLSHMSRLAYLDI